MEENNPRLLERDGDNTTETGSAYSTRNPDLRKSLMRQHRNRDPMLYFEVIRVLGFGSMGSVSQVKKRKTAIGGSSRLSFVMRNKRGNACTCLPIIGPMIKTCLDNRGKDRFWLAPKGDLLQEGPKPTGAGRFVVGRSLSSIMCDEHCNVDFALKTIHLDCIADPDYVEELKNEINLLKQLDHPNIVRAIETFDFSDQLFMVLELCSGGDLYTRDPYSESDAARIVCSILRAVEYMHSKNITHRDLKYENIMFTSGHPDADVKIIDFGLSKKYAPNDTHLHEGVGTIYTMAPEVVSGFYTSKADIWSVGVLAFMLLSSQMPFYGKKREHVIRKILQCKYRMKEKSWKHVSIYAKGFVMEMLQVDAKKRPCARVALRHPWLHHVILERSCTSEEIVEDVQASMHRYAGYSTLKKLALMVVSHQSTSGEIGILQKVFHKFDSEQEGHITYEEFKHGLSNYGYSEEELVEMFEGADLDGTRVLNYTEFLAATMETHGIISEERLAEAFDRLDSDDSGYISTENLREFLGHLPKEYLDRVIDEADLTRDNKISYREFLAMWNHNKADMLASLQKVQKRRLSTCKTSLTDSVSSSGSESYLSLPNPRNRFAPEITPEIPSDEDDIILGEIQFRQKKKLSIRKHQIVC